LDRVPRQKTLQAPLALAVSALLMFALANAYPLLSFAMEGRTQSAYLVSGTIEFWRQGFAELAIIVALTSIAAPLINLLCLVYVLLPLQLGIQPPGAARAFRIVTFTRPWAMLDVFLLGLLVALVKLSGLADIAPLTGFWAYCAVIGLMALANASLHPPTVWTKLDKASFTPAHVDHSAELLSEGYLGCHACGHVMSAKEVPAKGARCPRCATKIIPPEHRGLSTAWAYLIAAAIFYIPANVYPVMTVIYFGSGQSDTILSGVVHLAEAGEWPIALLIFVASVVVPVLKIIVLTGIYLSVQLDSDWCRIERTKLFSLTEAIGRWSMIDIFMVAILAALVKLDAVATIEPGLGAVAFCAVVILTMLSALAFDPKQIWLPRAAATQGPTQ
jgi:paraquat-inducible protein A